MRIEVVKPSELTATHFDAAVDSQLRMASALRVSSQKLISLRDMLLPKLVTGQIDGSSLDLDALLEVVA